MTKRKRAAGRGLNRHSANKCGVCAKPAHEYKKRLEKLEKRVEWLAEHVDTSDYL